MSANYMQDWERLFLRHRPYLISFTYRITGSLTEAEDIVQDTFVECAKVDPAKIENHKSWLTKVCSNKGLDHLKSAYKQRENYHGTWLPDAVPESNPLWKTLTESDSPEKNLLLSESLTTSFLLLIERLNPEERVIYLLSEIFDYSFKEVAGFLDKSEEACRKTAQRARESLADFKPSKTKTASADAEKLITQFFESAKNGDKTALLNLLADGSQFWADGGGRVPAAAGIFRDRTKIAEFFAAIGPANYGKFRIAPDQVSSRPGLLAFKELPSGEWTLDTVFSFEIENSQITRVYAQRNPDKLERLGT